MLDFDLAELYQVSTSALNQSVKRNAKRFPPTVRHSAEDIARKRDDRRTPGSQRPKYFIPDIIFFK